MKSNLRNTSVKAAAILPLEGVRVLDLTRLLPGAYCSLLLADMGADVIKVENPQRGDYLRWTPPLKNGQSVLFNALNRNKRSLALDLKSEDGARLFKELVRPSDVVIEGNRPGVMDRLGLGWNVLQALRPQLVLCSISGYGADGPMAARAGHDINYMALAGALSLNGPAGGAPVPYGVQVADFAGGGMGAAVAVLGALFQVARGGSGRHLDVSMATGVLGWLAPQLAEAELEGQNPTRGSQPLTGRYPCYRVYECSDGRYYSVGALEPKFWSTLCATLGLPELVPLQLAEGEDGARAHRLMETAFRSRTRDGWEQALEGLDACCEPVLALDEVVTRLEHQQRVFKQPTGLEVAPAVHFADRWRRLPPPRLGEHSAEVLAEAGVSEMQVAELRAAGVISTP